MENSIYIGLSKQSAIKTNMNIIANNLANMNTTGFRGQNILFQEYVVEEKGNADDLSFVYDYGQYQVTDEGSISITGNQLDVALSGPGFMMAKHPTTQETLYTRAGDFHISENGNLVTSGGYDVLSAGGAPIALPTDSQFITIDENGIISNQDGQIGSIGMVEFENIQTLEPVGVNMYKSTEEPVAAIKSKMKQGHLEGSNVNAITEMTRMIEMLRSFQSQNDIVKKEHERIRSAIQKLTAK